MHGWAASRQRDQSSQLYTQQLRNRHGRVAPAAVVDGKPATYSQSLTSAQVQAHRCGAPSVWPPHQRAAATGDTSVLAGSAAAGAAAAAAVGVPGAAPGGRPNMLGRSASRMPAISGAQHTCSLSVMTWQPGARVRGKDRLWCACALRVHR